MAEFTLGIAGCAMAVTANFENTRTFCFDYICDGEPDFSVEITPSEYYLKASEACPVGRN